VGRVHPVPGLYDREIRIVICSTNAIWVLYSRGWSGRCFPDQSWKRPALTLNAIDAEQVVVNSNCRAGRLGDGARRLA
jgi:hypothetical protein